MLQILANGQKYGIQELAEILEVSPRMVRFYKEELEKSGIFIDTIRGKYGGYYLKQHFYLPNISFEKADFLFLEQLKKEISEDKLKRFEVFLDKLKGITIQENYVTFSQEEEKMVYNELNKAIKNHQKVWIQYESHTKGLTERIIRPFSMIYLQRGFGCAAYCEVRQDLRHFELKRVVNLKLLEEYFE